MVGSNLFRRVPSFDKSSIGGKKLFYNLKQNSLPVGTMTEKVSAVVDKYAIKAYIDGDKELIYLSQKLKANITSVCIVDFTGKVVENGSVQGRTTHGSTQYKPFPVTGIKFVDIQKTVNALLGENPLMKIALSEDYDLLEKVMKNRTGIELLHFAQEFKTFSEVQNDWNVRAISNKVYNLAYEIIEAQGRSEAECAEK